MSKVELLSPAGTKEAFYASINAGTDAIYLGGKLFSARAYASNFSNEEIKEIIIYAHERNVKVYVTVNTLIFEDEFKEAIEFIEYLHEVNVDAILIQDLGLAHYLHKVYPNLVIHASTQLNCHNVSEAKALMELGFSRIVLARETPIENVKEIKKLGVEVEVFVHGALCVSYSGNCLMSSFIGNRSGNRGKCAQPCRNNMICQSKEDKSKDFALSMKDLCTIDHIDELIQIGVDSLKIEGRMKREEYVYEVVSSYRKAIDSYYKNQIPNVTLMKEEMKKNFNREFTKGFMFNESRTCTLNQSSSSHIGTHLGKVISKMKNYVLIHLDDEVNIGDGIRFNNRNQVGQEVQKMFIDGKEVVSASKGNIIKLLLRDNSVLLNDEVIKTTSIIQFNEIHKKMKINKRINIDIEVYAYLNSSLKMVGKYKDFIVNEEDEYIVEYSEKELSIDRLKEQVNRMGDSEFILDNLDYYGDKHAFIPSSVINSLRRKVIEKMELEIKPFFYNPKRIEKNDYLVNIKENNLSFNTFAQVENEEQLLEVRNFPYDKILVNDKRLYELYKDDKRIAYVTPRVLECDKSNCNDNEVINYIKHNDNASVFVSPYMNITNSYALDLMYSLGMEQIILSYELSKNRIKMMIDEFISRNGFVPNTYIPVYGYIDLMIMKSCPIATMYKLNKDHCNMCKKNHYYLTDRMNVKFNMIHDDQCNTRILNSLPLYLIDSIDRINSIGVKGVGVYFTLETENEVNKISNILFNKIDNDILMDYEGKTTKGHFNKDLD